MPSKRNTARHGTRHTPDLDIIFEDRDVIVVDKPAGLLTMSTPKERHATAYAILFDHVKSRRKDWRLFIVHRLDREASGLLVFAKTKEAQLDLQSQFSSHTAQRTYVAVTEGRIVKDHFTITSHLAENAAFRCYSTKNTSEGKRAVTHITVLKRAPHRALVEARLETGRKHQIRVHLAEQGNSIVGDPTYGNGKNPIRRMALHATTLVFHHPHTGKEMTFTSPMPESFKTLV